MTSARRGNADAPIGPGPGSGTFSSGFFGPGSGSGGGFSLGSRRSVSGSRGFAPGGSFAIGFAVEGPCFSAPVASVGTGSWWRPPSQEARTVILPIRPSRATAATSHGANRRNPSCIGGCVRRGGGSGGNASHRGSSSGGGTGSGGGAVFDGGRTIGGAAGGRGEGVRARNVRRADGAAPPRPPASFPLPNRNRTPATAPASGSCRGAAGRRPSSARSVPRSSAPVRS